MSKKKYKLDKKARLNSGNVCYLSILNLLSSKVLSRRKEVKIYRAKTSLFFLYGCEIWFVKLRNRLIFILFEIR